MRIYVIMLFIALLIVGCKEKEYRELLQVSELKSQLQELQAENEKLKKECRRLRKEYKQLKNVYNLRDAPHSPDPKKSSGIYDEVFQ